MSRKTCQGKLVKENLLVCTSGKKSNTFKVTQFSLYCNVTFKSTN
jgi:hypothetical protein